MNREKSQNQSPQRVKKRAIFFGPSGALSGGGEIELNLIIYVVFIFRFPTKTFIRSVHVKSKKKQQVQVVVSKIFLSDLTIRCMCYTAQHPNAPNRSLSSLSGFMLGCAIRFLEI